MASQRNCKWCGEPFMPQRSTGLYCSRRCGNAATRKRRRTGNLGNRGRTGLTSDDLVAMFVRSGYMRLWSARFRGEAYPAACIDADLLAAMVVNGHVVWSTPYHVWLTDDGVQVYAEGIRDVLESTKFVYESMRELAGWLERDDDREVA